MEVVVHVKSLKREGHQQVQFLIGLKEWTLQKVIKIKINTRVSESRAYLFRKKSKAVKAMAMATNNSATSASLKAKNSASKIAANKKAGIKPSGGAAHPHLSNQSARDHRLLNKKGKSTPYPSIPNATTYVKNVFVPLLTGPVSKLCRLASF